MSIIRSIVPLVDSVRKLGTSSNWKLESRWSKPQHCWDCLEYREESWRPEETCYHSDSSERRSTKTGEKNLQVVNNNNNDNNNNNHLELAKKLNTLWDMKLTDINRNGGPWKGSKKFGKEDWWTSNSRKSLNHPDQSTIKISLDT